MAAALFNLTESLNENADYKNILTPDLIHFLNTSLSKLGVSILKELYQAASPLQQKTLAANVHTSPTSLSNILSRLEAITPELLNSQRIGRSKYYSLTGFARAYVAQELLTAPGKIHPFAAHSQNSALLSETLDILHMFQSKAGIEWYFALDDLLSGKSSEYETDTELMELFSDFLDNMANMKLQNQSEYIHEIHKQLEQKILIGRLDSYLKAQLAPYYALKPLISLAKQDYETAALFIDYVFAVKIDTGLFSVPELPGSFSVPVSELEYNKITKQLADMANDIIDRRGNKLQVLEIWKKRYHTDSHCLMYIAEKCCFIYKIHGGKPQNRFDNKPHFLL